MSRIEEILNLFQNDTEVIKIVLSAYTISQRENKELSDAVFKQLLFLKQIQPTFCIKVNYKTIESSNYDPITNTINLNGNFNETTFFHELTHMFSFCCSKYDIPQEYKDFKSIFYSLDENGSMIISLLDLCKNEKQRILKNIVSVEKDINEINKNLSNESLQGDNNDYAIICAIEDIIDSLYDGKSHDYGLKYIKDNNSYLQKSFKSAGHGCDYFNKSGYEFEEIIADYQSINLMGPNNELFILLKQILGCKFVAFLDNRCQMINGEYLVENNVIKK